MSADSVTESDVMSWVEKALENLDITDYEVSINGKTEIGDGYSGEVVFVSATGKTKENKKTTLELVVKHGKASQNLRQKLLSEVFKTEIKSYDKVFPAFKKFQLEKNISDLFASVPRCHFTLILPQMEVLVLENLKQYGYELHDRKQPLNFNHLKLVLEEYGRWHALSFALKDQRVEEFNTISKLGISSFVEFLRDESVKEQLDSICRDVISELRRKGYEGLCKKYEKLLLNRAADMLLDVIDDMVNDEQRVIIHGDCWNNNFMFKYESDDRTSPSKVKILDWQLSAVRSPVCDLSYFIYANSSQKELERFDELMKVYHDSLSEFLKQLGSDPEQLFPFADLRRHWKKYSRFGFLLVPMILRFALCDKEKAPAFADLKEDQDMASFIRVEVFSKEAYYERLRAVTSHYFEYEF